MPEIAEPPESQSTESETEIVSPESQSTASETEDPNRPSSALQSEAERAYQRILDAIFRGDLLPTEDEPSSEIVLQKRFNLGSRMPIRMALAVLASEGVVAQRARHGFWVVDYSAHDLRQIGAMRADADAMVASFLGASISGEGITTESEFQRIYDARRYIEESLGAMLNLAKQAPAGDVGPKVEMAFADYDTRFHVFIAAATDYTLAARHIRQWRNLVRLYRAQHHIHYTGQDLLDICVEHQNLFELAARPNEERFDGIDAMIEEAATSHVMASLRRAGVSEEPPEAREDPRDFELPTDLLLDINRLKGLASVWLTDPQSDMRTLTSWAYIREGERVVLYSREWRSSWERAAPDVEVSIEGEQLRLRAREATADERDEYWPKFVQKNLYLANEASPTENGILVVCEPSNGSDSS
jgi:DNA-binding GntR family transcriptional regulator